MTREKGLVITVKYSHSHYRIKYTGNADGTTYEQADQMFMDKVCAYIKENWFVEIKQSKEYLGPEAHIRRKNPYLTPPGKQSK